MVDLDYSEAQWALFVAEWKTYQKCCRLGDSSPLELRACCSTELRRALFDFMRAAMLDTVSEEVLTCIRSIVVRGKTKLYIERNSTT